MKTITPWNFTSVSSITWLILSDIYSQAPDCQEHKPAGFNTFCMTEQADAHSLLGSVSLPKASSHPLQAQQQDAEVSEVRCQTHALCCTTHTFTLHQPQLHYKSKWSHIVHLHCVCSCGKPSASLPASLLNPNWLSSPDHASDPGARATPPESRVTAPSCKHTVALPASAQRVGPATCWQSICKRHHPRDSAKLPWQVILGKSE